MEKHYFDWPVRVYYEDTDCARVVYYANYFRFMERARTEWLRALGWSQERLYSELGVVFVVDANRPVEIVFFHQQILIRARVSALKKAP